MGLPQTIGRLTQNQPYTLDTIGQSGASIRLYAGQVLKIQPQSEESDREAAVMAWLSGKLPVPEILGTETEDGTSYLLMSRLPGAMSCAPALMGDPEQNVRMLAQGLQMLWQADVSDIPVQNTLEDKLRAAEYRVRHGLCDMENVEPGTSGPEGFSGPEQLLSWLWAHRPQITPVFSHGDY